MQQYTTTNIRLPREDLKQLKYEAVRENKSVAALIREVIKQRVLGVRAQSKEGKISFWDLPKYAVKTGYRHLARDADKIVYGGK